MSDNRRLGRMVLGAAMAGLLAPLGLAAGAAAEPAAPAPPAPAPPASAAAAGDAPKPRTIITQDGEVDDMDSFIRFLYYANEFDLEGIVYSSSIFHWRGEDPEAPAGPTACGGWAGRGPCTEPWRWTGTEWVDEYIDRYEEIYPNLVQHADGYPTPDHLRSIYRIGNVDWSGDMSKDTEGSDLIRSVLLDDEPGPVYVQTWGGLNTLARALRSIELEYAGTTQWAAIQQKITTKLVIYNILNQDNTLADYIRPAWPGIRIIDNQSQFWSFAYNWDRTVPVPYRYTLQSDFMVSNLLEGHGGLLERYRTYGDEKPVPGEDRDIRWTPEAIAPGGPYERYDQFDFISEGDSPAFMHLLDGNGLRSRENPTWGGWGGRFAEVDYGWLDTSDHNPYTGRADRSFPQTRWVEAIQNDFAARADWGVSDYDGANHTPRARVAQGLDLARRPGQPVVLTPRVIDPDGDAVTARWWQYREAGTYPGAVELTTNPAGVTRFRVPADAEPGQTIHVVLEATDEGAPALTHYQRVVVTVR